MNKLVINKKDLIYKMYKKLKNMQIINLPDDNGRHSKNNCSSKIKWIWIRFKTIY